MRLRCARMLIFPCALFLACASTGAHAQTGGAYDLSWNSLAGGQMFATGGAYSLGSTTGQPDAGVLAGGAYAISGGFWVPAQAPTTGVDSGVTPLPRVFAARLAGANPSQGRSLIQFDLPSPRRVTVALYGVDGRLVRRLIDGQREAGRHSAYWDGNDSSGRRVVPGMYFARVLAGESQATLRIVRIH